MKEQDLERQQAQQSDIYMMEDGTTYEVTPIRTWAYCGGRGYGWGYVAERVTNLLTGETDEFPIGYSAELAEIGFWKLQDPEWESMVRCIAAACQAVENVGNLLTAP